MDGAGGGAGGAEGGHDGSVYGGGFQHDGDCDVYRQEDSGGGGGGFLGGIEAFGHGLDTAGGEGVHDGGFAAEVVEGGGEADAGLGGEFSHGEFGFAFFSSCSAASRMSSFAIIVFRFLETDLRSSDFHFIS